MGYTYKERNYIDIDMAHDAYPVDRRQMGVKYILQAPRTEIDISNYCFQAFAMNSDYIVVTYANKDTTAQDGYFLKFNHNGDFISKTTCVGGKHMGRTAYIDDNYFYLVSNKYCKKFDFATLTEQGSVTFSGISGFTGAGVSNGKFYIGYTDSSGGNWKVGACNIVSGMPDTSTLTEVLDMPEIASGGSYSLGGICVCGNYVYVSRTGNSRQEVTYDIKRAGIVSDYNIDPHDYLSVKWTDYEGVFNINDKLYCAGGVEDYFNRCSYCVICCEQPIDSPASPYTINTALKINSQYDLNRYTVASRKIRDRIRDITISANVTGWLDVCGMSVRILNSNSAVLTGGIYCPNANVTIESSFSLACDGAPYSLENGMIFAGYSGTTLYLKDSLTFTNTYSTMTVPIINISYGTVNLEAAYPTFTNSAANIADIRCRYMNAKQNLTNTAKCEIYSGTNRPKYEINLSGCTSESAAFYLNPSASYTVMHGQSNVGAWFDTYSNCDDSIGSSRSLNMNAITSSQKTAIMAGTETIFSCDIGHYYSSTEYRIYNAAIHMKYSSTDELMIWYTDVKVVTIPYGGTITSDDSAKTVAFIHI